MTLEQLRIFVAVAEREHVTQASLALNLTQSAVSAAIAAIERQYATQLFDRIGRRVALTSAGRVFLDEAKAVLARAAMAEATLSEFAGLRRGSLSLAASQTIGNYWLPKFIHRFAARHSGVAMKLLIGNTPVVAALTREGAADLGLIEGNIDDAALAIEPVGDDERVLVAAPGIGFDFTEPARGLRAARFIMREAGSGTREMFEAALSAFGRTPSTSLWSFRPMRRCARRRRRGSAAISSCGPVDEEGLARHRQLSETRRQEGVQAPSGAATGVTTLPFVVHMFPDEDRHSSVTESGHGSEPTATRLDPMREI